MQRDVLFHVWQGDGHVPVAEVGVSWPVDPHEEVRVLVVPHISEPGLRFVFGGRRPPASLIAEVVDRRLSWLQAAAAADAAAARDKFLPVEPGHFGDNANIFFTAADLTVYGATLEPTELHFDHWVGRQTVPTGNDFVDRVLRQLASASAGPPPVSQGDAQPDSAASTEPSTSSSADPRLADSERWARQALDLLDLMGRIATVANSIETVNARASHDRALLLDAVAALRRQLPLHALTTLCIVDQDMRDEDLQWLLRAHLAGSNPGIPAGNDIRHLVHEMRRKVDARNSGPGVAQP